VRSPSAKPERDKEPQQGPVSRWVLFTVWFLLGFQSFGGGGATLALIRREVIQRRGWVSEAEFTQDWALCQLAPGINLTALAIVLGRRWRGIGGSVLCVLGLLLPSALATVLLTASYAVVRDAATTQAMLRAIVPASVGLGLLSSVQMLRSLLTASQKEGLGSVCFSVFIVAGSAAAALLTKLPVVLIFLGAGVLSALFQGVRRR